MNEILSKTLNALKLSKLSNYKIAQDTGISDQTIANYRNGSTVPRGANLMILSKYLCIDAGEIQKNIPSQKEEEATAAENAATMITIPQSVWAVIENQAASLKARDESLKIKDEQMNRLITQIEESNSILKTTILGTYTGFPATPADLGVKNPPPHKIGAKIMYINKLQKYIIIQTPDNKHSKKS